MKKYQLLIALSVLSLTAHQAISQEKNSKLEKQDKSGAVYRQIGDDGLVIYTDTPNQSLKTEKKIPANAASTMAPAVSSVGGSPYRAPSPSYSEGSGGPGGSFEPGTLISMPPLPGLPGASSVKKSGPSPDSSRANFQKSSIDKDVAAAGAENPIDFADSKVKAAEEALAKATKDAVEAATPLPGERIGTAVGGTRLNDDYMRRQEEVAEKIKNVRQALDEAIEFRKGL